MANSQPPTESRHLLTARSRTDSNASGISDDQTNPPNADQSWRRIACTCQGECRIPHLIEAILLCVNVAYGGFIVINVQYVFSRLVKDAIDGGYLPVPTLGSIDAAVCSSNSSTWQKRKLSELQAFSGLWEIAFLLARLSPPILLSNSIIRYTQKVGRKFALLLACIGGSLAMAIYLMGEYYNLWMGYFVFAIFIFGLTGGFYVPLACSYIYTMDHVPEEKRVFRYAIMSGINFLAFSVSTFVIGIIIDSFGYSGGFTTIFLPLLLGVIYIICLLPESLSKSQRLPQHEEVPLFYLPNYIDMFHRGIRAVNRPREVTSVRPILRCLLTVALLDSCLFANTLEAGILYMAGPSLCLNSTTISFACTVKVITDVVGPLTGARMFFRKYPEALGGILACVSGGIGFIVFGCAKSGLVILIGKMSNKETGTCHLYPFIIVQIICNLIPQIA